MSENKVIWHKYPKQKPENIAKEIESYLTTVKKGERIIVEILYSSGGKFPVLPGYEVIAWAKLPEPYKEDESI